ncbi:transposase [Micromonospora vinacea]|uniref:transposase n=1 Tax=Micromonospora vinacea TaxID=709878 RepID=UPI003D93C95A
MATTARDPARQAAGHRSAGHVEGGDRRLPHPGAQWRPKAGPSPVDRRKPGSKHHVITNAGGIPLAASLTGGNRHDLTHLLPLIDKIPPIKGIRGRPWQRPDRIYADRGYDYDCYRRQLRAKGSTPVIARRGADDESGLGPDASTATRTWSPRPSLNGGFRGAVQNPIDKLKALTSVSAGQGFFSVGTAGFEPTTP